MIRCMLLDCGWQLAVRVGVGSRARFWRFRLPFQVRDSRYATLLGRMTARALFRRQKGELMFPVKQRRV